MNREIIRQHLKFFKPFPIISVAIAWMAFLSCSSSKSRITIVDIGFNDRIELGEQLRIINQYKPKIIALDVLFLVDSLEKDSILVKEMSKSSIVQVLSLKDYDEDSDTWGRIEKSNEKFKAYAYGFANIMTSEDSVVYPSFILQEKYKGSTINSFAYEIANHSFGLKTEYKDSGNNELEFDLSDNHKNYVLIGHSDLANGSFKEKDIRGKIIILGYIGPKQDYFYQSEVKDEKINGIEIHAAILNTILAEP